MANDEISVQILLLKCVFKLIKPHVLIKYSNEFLNELNKTKNNKIIYELLRIIDKLLVQFQLNSETFKNSLLPFIKKFLKNNDHRLREICLKVLTFHFIDHEMCNNNRIFQILLSHSEDQDARVRVAALNLLVIFGFISKRRTKILEITWNCYIFQIMLHERGYKTDVKYYETLKHRLTDDFDQVRLLAIKIIWLLAITYPEQ